jgi:diaminopimelate decarboxylase
VIQTGEIARIMVDMLPKLGAEDTAIIGVNLPVLTARLHHLQDAFPEGVQHSIAIKTNPHPKMLEFLVSQGFGLEAASIEEVRMALAAGCSPAHLVFDSPVKTRHEIREISSLSGMLVNVNSLEELDRFDADFQGILGIRINPQVHTGAPELFDVSKNESKFGVPVDMKERIVDAALRYPVQALHMHSGSQMKDLNIQRGALKELKRIADAINAVAPGKIKVLDIGGGLPTETLGPHTRMEAYGQIVAEVFRDSGYLLVTEFGQWVQAEAGFALSAIEYVLAPNKLFIHLGADFFMRDAYTKARSFPMTVWNGDATQVQGIDKAYDIAGPLCFAGDYLAHGLELPAEVQEGQYLFMDHTGANTYALWSRHCSRTLPATWAWDGNSMVKWSNRSTIGF